MSAQNTTWALVKIAQRQRGLTTEVPYLVNFVGEGYDAADVIKWTVLCHFPPNQLIWAPEQLAAWCEDIKVEESGYQELSEDEALVLQKYLPCLHLSKGHLAWFQST